MSDLRKHERRHLLHKPLKCGHCDYEGVLNSDITSHCRRKHKDLEVSIIFNPAASKTPGFTPIVVKRRQKAAKSADEENEGEIDVVSLDKEVVAGGSDLETPVEEPKVVEGAQKKYKCLICLHTSDSYVYMRADHVRSHFKPFECAYCKKR